MSDLKFALVKQEVYQDLYVTSPQATAAEKLFSSMGRVGMLGLFTKNDCDFFIVKEEFTKECQIWRDVIPSRTKEFELLKDHRFNELPSYKFRKPGSEKNHSDFSVSCDQIDWSQYDIVISLNVSVPTSIVKKFPDTLWCYMIGEANLATDKVCFGYDACLNQNATGRVAVKPSVVDFPYTFVGEDCLEKIIYNEIKRPAEKNGIYAEINTTTKRPVTGPPETYSFFEGLNHKLRFHTEIIRDNLIEIYDSKYFVKIGGRPLRGNAIIEAISLGTPVLINPADLIHKEIVPEESFVSSFEDAYNKIKWFDNNPGEYQKLLSSQRKLVREFVFEKPLLSLKNCLEYKRQNNARKNGIKKMFGFLFK